VRVRRFRVGRRDRAAFDAVNARLMRDQSISTDEAQVYIENQFHCPGLYQHIRRHAAERLLIFIPYMFASTYYGAQIAPERSLIIPCLHDESYARLALYREVLPQARALILHTYAERDLAEALFGPANAQRRVVLGEGVDDQFSADAGRFRRKYGIDGPFLLSAGRREPGKNTPLLLDLWTRHVRRTGSEWQLVLIGPNELAGSAPQMRDLGFVSRQDKYDAMAAATLFCQPSVNESFSLVLMESWLCGTPALVHAGCAVTVEHCRRSHGGLYFADAAEFSAIIEYVHDHPATAKRMGAQGRDYVQARFTWPRIVAAYERLLAEVEAEL
jgi:glycosyltransferase involved in cell wall biosynthesis